MPVSLEPVSATSFYQTVADANVPNTCSALKQPFVQALNTTNAALDTLKSQTNNCLTPEVKYSEAIQTVLTERNNRVTQYTQQKEIMENYLKAIDAVKKATEPIDVFETNLEEERESLEKEHYELQQQIRAGRRRFLDADPQGGVQSILGLQTADDKVLLVFWICFALGVGIALLIFLLKYGDSMNLITWQQRTTVFLVLLLVSMGIALVCIRKFG